MPDNAKKVFEGKIFDVYQWDQELYDGTTAVFERLWRPDTLLVLAIKDDKIVITFDEQPDRDGQYSLPGGRIEKDEDPLSGAKRELLEETGLVSDNWSKLKEYTPYNKLDWNIHIFLAKQCKKEKEPMLDAGERITLKELSFDEFMELMFSGQYMEKEFAFDLLRMKLKNPQALEDFRAHLFD